MVLPDKSYWQAFGTGECRYCAEIFGVYWACPNEEGIIFYKMCFSGERLKIFQEKK